MEIEIKELKPEDESKVIDLIIQENNLNKYSSSKRASYEFAKQYWLETTLKATDILAAYQDGKLVGVLAANVFNKPKRNNAIGRKLVVSFRNWFNNIFLNSASEYDNLNQKMFETLKQNNNPDGEILFLISNSKEGLDGVQTALLDKFEEDNQNKLVYLFTDSHQKPEFLDKHGFNQIAQEEMQFNLDNELVPLTCYLYSKQTISRL